MSAWKEAIAQWERCRTGTVGELRALDPEYLDLHPAEGARTARELAVHIYQAAGRYLERFEPAGASSPASPEIPPAATADEIALALMEDWASSLKPRLERLEDRADVAMDGFFGRQSLLSHIWLAVAHEWYHRGQLATYVRLSGRVPALTQLIEQTRARR